MAKRGEFRFVLLAGYEWTENNRTFALGSPWSLAASRCSARYNVWVWLAPGRERTKARGHSAS